MKRLILEFSGYLEVNENSKFFHIETECTIPASEYQKLDEEQRKSYILESFAVAWEQSHNKDLVDSTLVEEE